MNELARHPHHPLLPKAGAGFKPEHLQSILADDVRLGFFEVHAENYMGEGGQPHAMLNALRERYPLSVHGVGLSIGGDEALDLNHLARFKKVVERYEPCIVSEHLAWSTHDTVFYNDLLPVPYTHERLSKVVEHIHQVQDVLGRKLLLENPSTYVAFEKCDMEETVFISEIVGRTGCGLLLDVNNVFISATNHAFSPEQYLAKFPTRNVEEIHLAGHATEVDDEGAPLLIDSHDRAVCNEVWSLYERVIETIGPTPTLIEWDNDVPEWLVLKQEAQMANAILNRTRNLTKRHAS